MKVKDCLSGLIFSILFWERKKESTRTENLVLESDIKHVKVICDIFLYYMYEEKSCPRQLKKQEIFWYYTCHEYKLLIMLKIWNVEKLATIFTSNFLQCILMSIKI